ncbi:MAG: sensor histidine kinase KdpD [Clostridia bacterium]|nr:sensor histidine kinase KdpD [Clostridia bacterium]
MASVFGSPLTALYVRTPDYDSMDPADRKRLDANIRLAENAGAEIVTTHGDDIPEQIAEYARLSGVTKIVIGIKSADRRRIFFRPTLTERLFELVPGIDIHVIPDTSTLSSYRSRKESYEGSFIPSWRDIGVTAALLAAATGIGFLFQRLGFTDANIITVYLLCVLLTSILTKGYTCGVIGSFISVILFNFFLTEPRLTLQAYGSGYPVTFAIMLVASILTSTLAAKLKAQAKLSAGDAFRTKLLFDTNRILQGAKDENEILTITASRISKLLEVDTVVFPAAEGALSEGRLFSAGDEAGSAVKAEGDEYNAAMRALKGKTASGARKTPDKGSRFVYSPIRAGDTVCGILGISDPKSRSGSSDRGIVQSILGECGLALENLRNAKGREEAAVLARNEKLRANLLRAISHDLRTPLTSISGNADTLLDGFGMLDDETSRSLLSDIRDDSEWLAGLVENLLSISKMGDGSIRLDFSDQVVDDVLEEAIRHIDRDGAKHRIRLDLRGEPMLARMDARLIIQVIINLVNNAVKHTPTGSEITVSAAAENGNALISVSDNGPGIPDEMKRRVFEMFFTGDSDIGDSRRSLGLGLPLCRSILEAHGSELVLTDNEPSGCVFSFKLPLSEVHLND